MARSGRGDDICSGRKQYDQHETDHRYHKQIDMLDIAAHDNLLRAGREYQRFRVERIPIEVLGHNRHEGRQADDAHEHDRYDETAELQGPANTGRSAGDPHGASVGGIPQDLPWIGGFGSGVDRHLIRRATTARGDRGDAGAQFPLRCVRGHGDTYHDRAAVLDREGGLSY